MIKQLRRFGIGGLCLLIGLLCLLPLYALAEVDIDTTFPDDNFRAYVLEEFDNDRNRKLSDTEIAAVDGIYVKKQSIASLEGLGVFAFLEVLDCSDNGLTVLPQLPDTLTALLCAQNQLETLPDLPDTLTALLCAQNQLETLPDLPDTLTALLCEQNQLEALPTLSNTNLTELYCDNNQLSTLPALPNTLTTFNCSQNQLTALPALPQTLTELYCYDNNLTDIPDLPGKLSNFSCNGNPLTALPKLPDTLTNLSCVDIGLTALPKLPDGLKRLYCSENQLTALPKLSSGLELLYCSENQLTALPTLPSGLTVLYCSNNQLTELPTLPSGLKSLYCNKNQLTAVNLLSLSNLSRFEAKDQTPTLLLTANGAGGYSLAIELNTPSFSVTVLNYANGVLTSDSKTLDKSDFAVQTGKGNFQLDGTFTLTYAEMIAASAGEGGSITPSGKVGVAYGEDKTFTIASDTGYRIKDVLVNGASIGKEASYTFENVQVSGSIAAQFEKVDYTITATAGKGGSIAPTGAVGVLHGESQTFTLTAEDGYRVKDVKVNGRSLGVMNSYTFENVQADATIEAIFEERPIDPVPPTGDRFPLEMLFVSLVGMVLVAVMLLRKAKKA